MDKRPVQRQVFSCPRVHGGVILEGEIVRMSTQDIIAELPKLNPDELRLVKQKVAELEAATPVMPRTGWGAALLEIAGSADDLPADLSVNHDHYLYGTPKRQ